MGSRMNLLAVAALLTATPVIALAQLQPPTPPTPASDANAPAVPAFPYEAEITGDNVHVRSGPGTNYYSCGKLNTGDKVTVVSHQFSWSCIVPPPGSFSWIYMPYVSIDPDNPQTGIVTGDDVRVYAGSEMYKPIHSTLQLKLDRGEKVKLLGEQKDNYYKIAPPSGAYLWVSTRFTRPIKPRTQATTPPGTTDANAPAVVDVNDANQPRVTPPETTKASAEAEKIKQCRQLQKELLAERQKPIDQQDYSTIKKALAAIAEDESAGKVARYCQLLLAQIERCELAIAVSKQLDLQKKELDAVRNRIEAAKAARLAQLKKTGRFAVSGRIEPSHIFGSAPDLKHYRIVDDSGKTICYARPVGAAVQMDLSPFKGKKVGLVGTITPHPATGGALVKFTEVVELK